VSILRFFGLASEPTPSAEAKAQTDTVRKIVDALDRLEPDRARYLAAFAYILSRVARADLHVSALETGTMESALTEHGGLTEDQAILVVQMAKHQNLLFGATEDFLVTREFEKISDFEQKIQLLDSLFCVAAAEGLVSVKEEEEIRQISNELKLTHNDYISVRSRYRDHLAVLKRNRPGDSAG
jgi:uncharacterized tellurite resistance protein B-like protein